MTKTKIQSLVFLVTTTIGVLLVAYYGSVANSESQVYRSVFMPYKSTSKSIKVIVLSKPNTCHIGSIDSAIIKDIPAVAAKNFLEKNTDTASPVRLGSIEGEIQTISWPDNKRLHEAGYLWKPQDETMLWLSRVGMNVRMTEAVVCIETIVPSSLGSYGTLIFLKKVKGEWKIQIERNAWIS